MAVMLFFFWTFLVKKGVWENALSWYNSKFPCRQTSGRNIHSFSRNRRKILQQYQELTVCPASRNSSEQSLWCIANDKHALDFSLHLSRQFRCWWFRKCPFEHPYTAQDFFSERFSNHCQPLYRTFSEICAKFEAHSLSDPLTKSTSPEKQLQIYGHKNSARASAERMSEYTLPIYPFAYEYMCAHLCVWYSVSDLYRCVQYSFVSLRVSLYVWENECFVPESTFWCVWPETTTYDSPTLLHRIFQIFISSRWRFSQ